MKTVAISKSETAKIFITINSLFCYLNVMLRNLDRKLYLKNIKFQKSLRTFKTFVVSAVTSHLFGRDFLDTFDLNQNFYFLLRQKRLRFTHFGNASHLQFDYEFFNATQ